VSGSGESAEGAAEDPLLDVDDAVVVGIDDGTGVVVVVDVDDDSAARSSARSLVPGATRILWYVWFSGLYK
jgi:hypothetical protein